LHYYRARWYDSNLGRFISEDPIGFAGGDVNLYGYVWNSPTDSTDPFGEDGFGNDLSDYLDERIDYAERYWRYDDQEWIANGINKTIADVAYGFSDMFRIGNGIAQAYYCEDTWAGRAAFVLMDVSRGAGLFTFFGAPGARFANSRLGLRLNKFTGREIELSGGSRIAPLGNRTGHPTGRFPHYHRRVLDQNGNTLPGQGIKRHRPWDTRSTDKSFWDRF